MIFLAKFFVTYILLTVMYQSYLDCFNENDVDTITTAVAEHSKALLHLFDVNFETRKETSDLFIKLIYNDKYVARMIEGCNAVSIIILFIAFIVSFSGKIKQTLLFIAAGSVVVYFLNVIRIAVLCVLLYCFPEQESFLHKVFFPLFIYGFVFLLWVVWVNKFSLYAKENTSK